METTHKMDQRSQDYFSGILDFINIVNEEVLEKMEPSEIVPNENEFVPQLREVGCPDFPAYEFELELQGRCVYRAEFHMSLRFNAEELHEIMQELRQVRDLLMENGGPIFECVGCGKEVHWLDVGVNCYDDFFPDEKTAEEVAQNPFGLIKCRKGHLMSKWCGCLKV